jgi:hypothetical protein
LDEKAKNEKTAVTVVTKPENVYTEPIVTCHNDLRQTVTSCDKVSERPTEPTPTDYRPTQQELVNAQPLPPLIDLAKLIPFESLAAKETIYDGNHTPYTLKQLIDGNWECTNGRFITPSNISSFHRAPKTAWD